MRESQTGWFRELDVDCALTVTGSVEGVTVRRQWSLIVIGQVAGNVALEWGAQLIVYGNFSSRLVTNRGIILVAGTCDIDRASRGALGHLAVAPGTLLPGGSVLQPDGSEALLEQGRPRPDVNVTRWCGWLEYEGRFAPQQELEERCLGS